MQPGRTESLTTPVAGNADSAPEPTVVDPSPTYVETYVEPVVEEPVAAAEPYIVDCQMGAFTPDYRLGRRFRYREQTPRPVKGGVRSVHASRLV